MEGLQDCSVVYSAFSSYKTSFGIQCLIHSSFAQKCIFGESRAVVSVVFTFFFPFPFSPPKTQLCKLTLRVLSSRGMMHMHDPISQVCVSNGWHHCGHDYLLIDLSHICCCLQVLWQTSEQRVGLNLLMWFHAIFCRELVFVSDAFVCSFVFDIHSNCLGLIPLSNNFISCNWFLPGPFASFKAAVCDRDSTGNGCDLFFEHEITRQQCCWIRQDYCEGWETKTIFNLDSWHWKSVFKVVRWPPLNRLVFPILLISLV